MVKTFKLKMIIRWILLGVAAGAAQYPVLNLPLRGATYAFIVTIGTLLGAYALTYRWELERDVTPHYAVAVLVTSTVVWYVADLATVLPPASTHAGGVSRFLVGVAILAANAYALKRYFALGSDDD